MRKTLAAGMAALTFGTAVAATALPAQADGYRHRRDNNDAATAAVVAGVAGLALGAALSNGGHSSSYYGYRSGPAYGYAPGYAYRSGYGYRRGAYAPGYAYGYGPRLCESRRWVWDPYIGRRVMVRSTYRC